VLLVVLGILAGYALFDKISLAALAFLASLWAMALLLFLRRGWLSLLGPLFLFDLLRTTRRSRYFLLRIYVYFILVLLFCVFVTWTSGRRINLRANRGAAIAENVFFFFLCAHLALTALFTPGYVASALTEEKERNTLEALMATDLSSREIVLSKLAVRLANLGLMLLTGLPILAIMQVMGGVDPDFLMVGFVAILFFTATLACLAISNSVRCRRSRDAILATYLEMGAYLVLTFVLFSAFRWWLPPLILNLGWFQLSVWQVIDLVGYGNPILGLDRILEHVASGGQMSRILGTVVVQFVTFHLVVSILLAADAVRRFRRAFRKQTYGQLVKDSNHLRRLRPGMGNWPLHWKEVFTESANRKSWFRRLLMGLLIVASFLPVAVIERDLRGAPRIEIVQVAYFHYVCVVGCGILCILLIRVVVQAALSFSRERDQQTLDSLLTCPVSTPSIIGAKWLGCMLSVRWLWLWLAAIWAIGVAMAGMPGKLFVTLLALWFVYAGVGTLFGQWCSLMCKTSLRAIVFTLLALAITTSGILILPLRMGALYVTAETSPGFRTWLLRGQFGMAPPIVFNRTVPLKFMGNPAENGGLASWEWPAALVGTGIWLGAGAILWILLCGQVRDQARRATARRPQEDKTSAVPSEEAKPVFSYPVN
jgi:ABC-type transport system involved in multi-copper enzyme maturation permease subunit